MARKKPALKMNAFEDLYNQIPAFVDVFDEETFYLFAFFTVICAFLLAFILSRFITIKSARD